ncbi:hypothetical protein VN97_g4907 [Penicillium thymicola]|uniref:Uncharacterized protein n=1 Tax=Penicillium thymicola TaxID=293382 RepID=A0AAI9X9G5_PENTH|nr:hypothetical protein VN97_g4907 [Penicillium thymicola]
MRKLTPTKDSLCCSLRRSRLLRPLRSPQGHSHRHARYGHGQHRVAVGKQCGVSFNTISIDSSECNPW